VVGPTDSGKTFLVADLLARWRWKVLIATKRKDKTYSRYSTFRKRESWRRDWYDDAIFLHARPKQLGNTSEQKAVVYECLSAVFEQGGWTVVLDDLYYISTTLKLKESVQMMYTQVRSGDITMLANIQRPQWNPLECLSQAKYVIVFKIYEEKDIARVAEATSINSKQLMNAIAGLHAENHEFLFIQQGSQKLLKVA